MLRRTDWEREFEGCTLAGGAVDGDGAAEFFDRGLHDVETDAATGDLGDLTGG